MEKNQMNKTTVLRKAVMDRRAVVVPGCHDALSAKVIEACGFEAIQISGYGLAASLLGKPDVALVQMKDVLDLTWNFPQAVRRCNLELDAGADLALIDGIKTKADIEKAVKALRGPLSVNLMDAISGMKTELVPIPELAAMGVGRISIPVASIMVAHKALTDFFTALKQSPTGILAGQHHRASSFEQFTDFVGLKDYRKLEDQYLPKERI